MKTTYQLKTTAQTSSTISRETARILAPVITAVAQTMTLGDKTAAHIPA
jgi:hypothetical protein